ncbi:MAG TPA: hypothetical protein VF648_00465 [Pyrinomonadaceae bacterium]|jgi:hypothetical protein
MTDVSQEILTAGRELDLLVQEKVLKKAFPSDRCPVCGWQLAETQEAGCLPNDCSQRPAPLTRADEPPAYSSLINMAWIIVEHLRRQGWLVTVKEMPDGFPFEIGAMEREGEINRRAVCELRWMPTNEHENTRKRINCHPFAAPDTAPLAICLAALEAEEK